MSVADVTYTQTIAAAQPAVAVRSEEQLIYVKAVRSFAMIVIVTLHVAFPLIYLYNSIAFGEKKRVEKIQAEIAIETSPPNPLRVCAEIGKRLGPSDIVIGDSGDFVATAANVLRMEWPQV